MRGEEGKGYGGAVYAKSMLLGGSGGGAGRGGGEGRWLMAISFCSSRVDNFGDYWQIVRRQAFTRWHHEINYQNIIILLILLTIPVFLSIYNGRLSPPQAPMFSESYELFKKWWWG
jgi:hypothetical protein